jgi:hypothetical protein
VIDHQPDLLEMVGEFLGPGTLHRVPFGVVFRRDLIDAIKIINDPAKG